jgi:hypothetical protein
LLYEFSEEIMISMALLTWSLVSDGVSSSGCAGTTDVMINDWWTGKNVNRSVATYFNILSRHLRRSQWPSGLRHEQSSLARTLESWVRILLKEWVSVCVYSVFVLFCV